MAINILDEIFDFFTSVFDDKTFISPVSIGGKIKRYRELRGWSQKELGIRCGYSPSTADVRIGQYEKNKKIPREKALKDIAAALKVDDCALFDADLLVFNRMYHALFDIEDIHGLHPVKINDEYYLEFSGPTIFNPQGVTPWDYRRFLRDWYNARNECERKDTDSFDDIIEKEKKYALWHAEYPYNEAEKQAREMANYMKETRLREELDEVYAKNNNEKQLNRIDEELAEILPRVRKTMEPIKKESDLIYLIKDMMEAGIVVEQYPPNLHRFDRHKDGHHLVSMKVDDVLSADKIEVFAKFVYAIETITSYGVESKRLITSKNQVFYITYTVERYIYISNIKACWDEMVFLVEVEDRWTPEEVEELTEKFNKNVTGSGDTNYLTINQQ